MINNLNSFNYWACLLLNRQRNYVHISAYGSSCQNKAITTLHFLKACFGLLKKQLTEKEALETQPTEITLKIYLI